MRQFLIKQNLKSLFCSLQSLDLFENSIKCLRRSWFFLSKYDNNLNRLTLSELKTFKESYAVENNQNLKFNLQFTLEKKLLELDVNPSDYKQLSNCELNNLVLRKYLSKFKFTYLTYFESLYFDDKFSISDKELNTIALKLLYSPNTKDT